MVFLGTVGQVQTLDTVRTARTAGPKPSRRMETQSRTRGKILMKMIYIAALAAGTALVPAHAYSQQTPAGNTANNSASQAGQANPVVNRVQAHIQQALQALDNGDMQAARQAVQEARRQLNQQAQSGQEGQRANAVAELRQPLQQAEQALAQQNAEQAEEALSRVEQQMASMDSRRQNAEGGADVVVEDQASIRVDVPEPDVTVQQANPRVAVQQQQPEITVHQPAPTVTVDIPQPQITVRMPEPDVRVSQSQPQVQVEQGQPQVRVSENEPRVHMQGSDEQANVQLQRSGEPVVQMQRSEQEPNIRYTAEEAQVRVNRAEGEPEVRFEQQNERQATANQDRQATDSRQARSEAGNNVDRQNTAAIPRGEARDDANTAVATGSSREVALTVADIKDYDIVGANGNDLGDIDEVVNINNRLYAVVTSGGFLGLGENRAAVPLSALRVTDQETLEAPNVTERQIDGMANFQSDRYQSLPDEHPVTLGAR